jgi:2-hydroxychromene-2-carboxylate isomerase
MKTIQYYLAAISPWTYLGHTRLAQIAQQAGATIEVLPCDLGGVFAVSGGLPLPKRAPQRQAYRLVELRRWSEHLGMPMNVTPAFFPTPSDLANKLVVATQTQQGGPAAMRIAGAIMAATWARELNIANDDTLAQLLSECELPAALLEQAKGAEAQQKFEANTQAAIAAQVFGAPSYVVDGELFWGQDRLDFLARKLGLAG